MRAWVAIFSASVGTCLLLSFIPAAARRPVESLPPTIPEATRRTLEGVIDRPVVSTRMAADPYVARPQVFEYLLDHLEFATHVTRALKVARYRVWHTDQGQFLDDGWGATGRFEVVHAEPGRRVFYARGQYDHALMPTIHGDAVIFLEYAFRQTPEGRTVVATTVGGSLRLDSRILALAGVLATPILRAEANREARHVLKVFAKVTRALEDGPDAVYEKVRQRPDVPQEELVEFRRLLTREFSAKR